MYFDAFSVRAKRAVFFAHDFASREDREEIEPEHLVRGLFLEEPSLLLLLRPTDGSSVEKIRSDRGTKPRRFSGNGLPLSNQSREIVRRANRECKRRKHDAV